MNPNSWRRVARRLYPLKKWCERCKTKKAKDRHHKDGDFRNNEKINIAHLCRKCHMEVDGRLVQAIARTKEMTKKTRCSPKLCRICFTLSKPLRHGRCHPCTEYYRRHGIERAAFLSGITKQRCRNGHTYTTKNTYITSKGTRSCRECHRLCESKRRRRQQ